MTKKIKYYSVTPKIVRAGARTTVKIKGLYGHSRFVDDAQYRIVAEAVERKTDGRHPVREEMTVKAKDGQLSVSAFFAAEQEYQLTVFRGSERVECFCIYALESDLYERYPYKGDLHMHTIYSDGIESPEYVAAACREIGCDFIAVTDHHKYAPSVEAQEAYSGVRHDMRIFRGEEIHPLNRPDRPEKYVAVHLLSIGAGSSVNELYSKSGYISEIEELASKTDVPEGVDAFDFASCAWAFEKIKDFGGLSVFCHPYWRIESGYHCSTALAEHLIETKLFDAIEVISGYDNFEVESNTLQASLYWEYARKGIMLPAIGVSDSHGAEAGRCFGWYYTVAFAKSPEFEDIKEGIMNFYSVAAEQMPNAAVRFYGPHRLVKYALFLYREVFPLHDEICAAEGRLMKQYAAFGSGAELERMSGSTDRLYIEVFGRNVD